MPERDISKLGGREDGASGSRRSLNRSRSELDVRDKRDRRIPGVSVFCSSIDQGPDPPSFGYIYVTLESETREWVGEKMGLG